MSYFQNEPEFQEAQQQRTRGSTIAVSAPVRAFARRGRRALPSRKRHRRDSDATQTVMRGCRPPSSFVAFILKPRFYHAGAHQPGRLTQDGVRHPQPANMRPGPCVQVLVNWKLETCWWARLKARPWQQPLGAPARWHFPAVGSYSEWPWHSAVQRGQPEAAGAALAPI